MSAKHTPAPWVVNPKYRSPVVGYDLGDGDAPLPIVDVVHGYDAKQARANARLIAAAPELLAALRLMLASHDASCPGESCQITGIDLARAAIAKATGEQP